MRKGIFSAPSAPGGISLKWIVGGIIVVIIALLLFTYWGKIKSWFTGSSSQPGQPSATGSTTTGTASLCTPGATLDVLKTLSKGSRSNEVCVLQKTLNKYKFANLEVDGIFGPKTEAAVLNLLPSNDGKLSLNTLEVYLRIIPNYTGLVN